MFSPEGTHAALMANWANDLAPMPDGLWRGLSVPYTQTQQDEFHVLDANETLVGTTKPHTMGMARELLDS